MFSGENVPLIGGKKEPPLVFKYFVLFVISLICFGPYFAFDSIQVLSRELLFGFHKQFWFFWSLADTVFAPDFRPNRTLQVT